jgi:hypothetical protein
LARDWILSKDDWKRQAAVQALREFPSATNAALLRVVLGDNAWHVEHSAGRQERVYYIRESVCRTLQEWKFSVFKPLLREPWKEP